MSFIRLSNVFLPVSALLAVTSLVLVFVPGPQLSIEFTGGTLMEFEIGEGKTTDDLRAAVGTFADMPALADAASITHTSAGTLMLRTPKLENEEHTALVTHLGAQFPELKELQFTTIGPTVGESLKERSIWALIIAIIAIVLYLALVFRRMPGKLSAWSFGVVAIIALIHDTLIVMGVFTILSHVTSFQLDTLFVTALLSIMGYSVNDTIVIFDRIRGNLLLESSRVDLPALVDRSLHETITRTLNTGAGALIMLTVLYFFAAESIRWFVLAMIAGTLIGTYSSFFVAAPLVVLWQKRSMANKRR